MRGGYNAYVAALEKRRDELSRELLLDNRSRGYSVNDVIALFSAPPPESLAAAYELSEDDFASHLDRVQRKYLNRFKNIRRSWACILQYLPETMDRTRRLKVLEMSTAHGATLEIMRFLGHDVVGNDYANFLSGKGGFRSIYRPVNTEVTSGTPDDLDRPHDAQSPDWPYRPIIESLGIDMALFDAGVTPYPLADASFDVICCFDALEHYCHPRDWMTIIDEFTRIARESVLLILNPLRADLRDNAGYVADFHAFQTAIRAYCGNGFRCVLAIPRNNQLTVFKLMKLG